MNGKKQLTRVGAHGVARQNGKVLLVEHASGPYKGKFALPGGKIEHGETPEQALRREFQEEVCGQFTTVRPLDNFHVTVTVGDTDWHQIGLIYTVEDFSQINGVAELKSGWYDLAALKEDQLSPFVQQLQKLLTSVPKIACRDCLYRQADRSDLRVLAEMRWDFKLEDELLPIFSKEAFLDQTEKWLQKWLSSGQWVYWLAEKEGAILAHVFCCRVSTVPTPSRIENAFGYVTNVYTKPEHRGMGIGSALMQCVKQWAISENLELLLVWPSSASEHFYARCGFEIPSDLQVLHI